MSAARHPEPVSELIAPFERIMAAVDLGRMAPREWLGAILLFNIQYQIPNWMQNFFQ